MKLIYFETPTERVVTHLKWTNELNVLGIEFHPYGNALSIDGKSINELPCDVIGEITNWFYEPKQFFNLMFSSQEMYDCVTSLLFHGCKYIMFRSKHIITGTDLSTVTKSDEIEHEKEYDAVLKKDFSDRLRKVYTSQIGECPFIKKFTYTNVVQNFLDTLIDKMPKLKELGFDSTRDANLYEQGLPLILMEILKKHGYNVFNSFKPYKNFSNLISIDFSNHIVFRTDKTDFEGMDTLKSLEKLIFNYDICWINVQKRLWKVWLNKYEKEFLNSLDKVKQTHPTNYFEYSYTRNLIPFLKLISKDALYNAHLKVFNALDLTATKIHSLITQNLISFQSNSFYNKIKWLICKNKRFKEKNQERLFENLKFLITFFDFDAYRLNLPKLEFFGNIHLRFERWRYYLYNPPFTRETTKFRGWVTEKLKNIKCLVVNFDFLIQGGKINFQDFENVVFLKCHITLKTDINLLLKFKKLKFLELIIPVNEMDMEDYKKQKKIFFKNFYNFTLFNQLNQFSLQFLLAHKGGLGKGFANGILKQMKLKFPKKFKRSWEFFNFNDNDYVKFLKEYDKYNPKDFYPTITI